MRQVDITILKSRLNYELKNLPFEIIKNGKVVGIVTENIKPDLKKSSPQKHKKKQLLPAGQIH